MIKENDFPRENESWVQMSIYSARWSQKIELWTEGLFHICDFSTTSLTFQIKKNNLGAICEELKILFSLNGSARATRAFLCVTE